MRARRRGVRLAIVAVAVVLTACSSSRREASAPLAPTTTVVKPAAIPPNTWQLGTTRKTCLLVQRPAPFPYPTFLQSAEYGVGKLSVVRVADSRVVQVLAPPCPPRSRLYRTLLRSPNGHVLAGYPQWTDLVTGVVYPGNDATVSPDGTRVATQIEGKRRAAVIRQYDAATGRVLSDLVAGYELLGFGWSADGSSLLVAVPPDSAKPPGIYLVPRAAHALPDQPDVPAPGHDAYLYPAALSNGHVVVAEYPWPDQHEAWPTTIVDLDPQAHTARTVLGDFTVRGATRNCSGLPVGRPFAAGQAHCYFSDPEGNDANGNGVLVSGQHGIAMLYDGSTVRRITRTGGNVVRW